MAIVKETERAVVCDDTRTLYQILKGVILRPTKVDNVLLKHDRNVIPDQARIICWWKEHFKELLNHVAPRIPPAHHC